MLADARTFLAAHARILDRRRFERLFEDGPAAPVRDAVAAYRNADGGFGHALEPDCRAPGSQAGTLALALRTLHEADAWDAELVAGACAWLEAVEPAAGGAPFVDPSIEGWPAAPWWVPEPGSRPSLVTTGPIAGTLLARGVDHPWLHRAVDWLWTAVAGAEQEYQLRGAVAFLDAAPDGERALAALRRLAPRFDGVLTSLDVAPLPSSRARALYDRDDVDAGLDRLAGGQRGDGGWMFSWPVWSPVAEADWRGSITVDALVVLRANGRLEGGATATAGAVSQP